MGRAPPPAQSSSFRLRKAVLSLICLFLGSGLISLSCAGRLSADSRQKLEVQKHLKRLNKPPVKTIQTLEEILRLQKLVSLQKRFEFYCVNDDDEQRPDGDIIDCIHISHQPAFDRPFLKDHKIQMRRSYHPEGLYDVSKVSTPDPKQRTNPITQLWHMHGSCPEETIPVRRTREDDALRATSVKRYGKKKHRSFPKPRSADPDLINQSGHQHSMVYVEGDKYYGAKATINVWEPKFQQPNEFSLSQLWILDGSFGEDLNSIEAGWLQSDAYISGHGVLQPALLRVHSNQQ